MGRKILTFIGIAFLLSACTNNINRAASRQSYIDVKYYIEHGSDPNERNQGWTPLTWAAYNGNHQIARYLLENGANVDLPKTRTKKQPKYNGYTPLHFAAFYGHKYVTEVLLEFGANKHLRDAWNNTALDYAFQYGFHDVAKMIEDTEKK
ncbi:ankyrin repeat domain-containing protein [bacterium]|nr:ankyrin repeat domain-containing protein [bacterium]